MELKRRDEAVTIEPSSRNLNVVVVVQRGQVYGDVDGDLMDVGRRVNSS